MKNKGIAITFRPKNGITDKQIEMITNYCIKLCDYYCFITEKVGNQRHLHGACFLSSNNTETKYFNRDIKKKVLKPMVDYLSDGTILKHAYVGKTIYNSDWVAGYLQKGDDTKRITEYLPDDKATLHPYYCTVTPKVNIKDYTHYEFEKAYYEKYTLPHCPTTDDVLSFLCFQMYIERSRKCILCPRKVKNFVHSLYSYMNKAQSYYFHSNIQLHDPLMTAVPRYTCTVCGYTDSTSVPASCGHMTEY